MTSLVRGMLISYGVGAFAWLQSTILPVDADASSHGYLQAIGVGLGLQILLIAVRMAVKRYERVHRMENELAPQAMFIFELLADGVTVLLFAISTFGAVAKLPSGI